MKPKLSTDPAVGYSPSEEEVFAALPLGPRKITTNEIVARRYGEEAPYHGRQIVIGVLRSLERKVRHNRERFRIKNTRRSGPHSMSFWLEKL